MKSIISYVRPLVILVVLTALFLAAIGTSFSLAAEISNEADQSQRSSTTIGKERKQQRWAAFPVIASSPETGLILGGMLFHFFPTKKPEQQASAIDFMAYGTTKGQYVISVTPDIFFRKGTYRLNANFATSFWKANYYLQGNNSPDISEEYESTNFAINLTLERRFFDSFILDLITRYENSKMDIIPGGLLDTGNVPGSLDGEYVGVGFALGYDTRDNTNAPARGLLSRYEYVTYDESIGSTLDFKIQTFDIRYYTSGPVIKGSVIALATQVKSASGEVPFRYLPSPDGTNILRGIENGRYRDEKMASLQLEYRFPIYKRFSGTVFTEFAQVAADFSDMELDGIKTSIGTGFRYALNPEQRFNIRGDIAWVDDGIGVIINIREAF